MYYDAKDILVCKSLYKQEPKPVASSPTATAPPSVRVSQCQRLKLPRARLYLLEPMVSTTKDLCRHKHYLDVAILTQRIRVTDSSTLHLQCSPTTPEIQRSGMMAKTRLERLYMLQMALGMYVTKFASGCEDV